MTFSIVARTGDAYGVAVAGERVVLDMDLYFGSPGKVLPLEGPLADEVRQHLMTLEGGQPDLRDALEDWAGEANFEMRTTPDGIDRRVLQALREADA